MSAGSTENVLSNALISLSEAALLTPYSAEYLSLRARSGKLKAVKIARNWLTTREAVLSYVEAQQRKHGYSQKYVQSEDAVEQSVGQVVEQSTIRQEVFA